MLLKILKKVISVRITKVEMKLKQSGNEVGGAVVKYTFVFLCVWRVLLEHSPDVQNCWCSL